MKTSTAEWLVRDAYGNTLNPDTSTEVNGYFTSMPAGATSLLTTIAVDPTALPTTDRYVVTWSGQGAFSFIGANVVSTGDHTMTIQVNSDMTDTWNSISLYIGSINSSDPLSNFHVVREDQVSLYNSGQTFAPDFLAKVSQMSVVRFMDWEQTNFSPVHNWSDESNASDRSWASTHGSGVPLSVMVDLCNQAHVDMWYNIPAEASDDVVKKSLTYIHDHLDPTLNAHIEYSNEVWNWSFGQASYAQTQANALWGTDTNGDGHVDSVSGGNLLYYGYRAAQISSMAHTIWGTDAQARLDMVISTQTSPGAEQQVFQGVQMAGLGTVSQLFHDYAITGYFGGGLTGAAADPTAAAQVLAWANSGAAGLTAAFQQIEHGGSIVGDSIDALAQIYQYEGQVANQNGLNLVVYEGGPSFYNQFPADQQATINTFLMNLLHDPRMGALISENLANFQAAGGDLFNAYQDTGGYFQTLDTIYDNSSTNWQAYASANTNHDHGVNLTLTSSGGTLNGGDGSDWLAGGAGIDVLNGNAGADTLTGAAGNDTLNGGDGDDYLDGGTGVDNLTGGNGDDIYIVDDRRDVVVEAANGGYDTVRTTASSYTLPANVEALTYTGSGSFCGTGNAQDNLIRGGTGVDVLHGGAGNDTLYGGAGNDALYGEGGDDKMIGGTGDDRYYVDSAGDQLVENPNEGKDSIYTTLNTFWMSENFENLTFTGTGDFNGRGNSEVNVITGGAGNDLLLGYDGNDHLYGGDGSDNLDGGAGHDLMSGGMGDDTYNVDSRYDNVVEAANAGHDQVFSSVTYTLPANVEDLTLLGSTGLSGTGNALDNSIWGTNGANVLTGYAGNDNLYGLNGNDTLDGGDGNDNLQGGSGHDVMTGGAGNDTLNGGADADTMTGGTGDDTYYVDNSGDKVIEAAREGTDTVYSSIDYTLGNNLENLTLTGSATHGTGNGLGNAVYDNTTYASGMVVTLQGLGGDDYLVAGSNTSTLDGGAGNDTLQGGSGSNTLIGGAGQDTLYGGTGADTFVYRPGDIGAVSGTTEMLWDFSHSEGDKLDFSAFESSTGGHGLTFIGGGAFTGLAGQVQAANGAVSIDLDGDSHADVVLGVYNNGAAIVASDLIL